MVSYKIKNNNSFTLIGMAVSLIIMSILYYFTMKVYFKPTEKTKGEEGGVSNYLTIIEKSKNSVLFCFIVKD